jgi:hypothetical protein
VSIPAVEGGRRFKRSSRSLEVARRSNAARAVGKSPPGPCRDAAVDTNCGTKGDPNYCTVSCTITHTAADSPKSLGFFDTLR